MTNALDSIVAHLAGHGDPIERLAAALRGLPAEQRRRVLAQFCPKCRSPRGPGWWDAEDCERCERRRVG